MLIKPTKKLETFPNPTPTRDYHIHMEIPEVLDLIRSKEIVDTVENVLEGPCVALQTVCSFKKHGTPSAKYAWNPHQDNSYIKCEISTYVSGDIALEDHLDNSGVLYVYPALILRTSNRKFDRLHEIDRFQEKQCQVSTSISHVKNFIT